MPGPQLTGARKVPAGLARQLIKDYQALPPRAVRWKTVPGRAFQTLLFEVVDQYGHTATADAVHMSRQAIDNILRKPRLRDSQVIAWPTDSELQDLRRAWTVFDHYRKAGLTIGPSAGPFKDVQAALRPLLGTYDLTTLARATGIPTRRLRRFE